MIKCTNPKIGRLAPLYEFEQLSDDEKRLFEAHLLTCDYCFQQLYEMAPVIKMMQENSAECLQALSMPVRPGWRERLENIFSSLKDAFDDFERALARPAVAVPGLAAICLAIAAAILLRSPHELADLAEIKPVPYIPIAVRGPADLTETQRLVDEGMAFYGRQAYDDAIIKFSRVVLENPTDIEAQFYLGLSFLLTHQADSAIVHLEVVASTYVSPILRERSYWYLGNAWLLKGDARMAQEFFEKAVALDGDYRRQAEELIDKIIKLTGK